MKKRDILIVAIFAVLVLTLSSCTKSEPITNFEECIAAGNPVMESYPRQCNDPVSGETFVEEIEVPVGDEIVEEVEEPIEEVEEPIKEEPEMLEPGLDIIYKTDNLPAPMWIIPDSPGKPWEGSLYIAYSDDGKTFTGNKFFVQHAGVGNLLYANDMLIATFQYFSYEDEDMFDVIAYTTSNDMGKTWSKVRKLKIDVPPGPSPVDPTLVWDNKYRLYFTFHQHGSPNPTLYSAVSDSLEKTFKNEGEQLKTDALLLDPAVVKYKGVWHHYTVNHGGEGGIHSISDNGLNFERQEDIVTDYSFLGQALVDGNLKFYGTKNGIILAESDDGYKWTKVKEDLADGADPGVAKTPEGYVMIYTRY